jgi:hypothetical protein
MSETTTKTNNSEEEKAVVAEINAVLAKYGYALAPFNQLGIRLEKVESSADLSAKVDTNGSTEVTGS